MLYVMEQKKTIFLRTCVIPDYKEEIEDMIDFNHEIRKKYPTLVYIIIFIIPEQSITTYYKNIDNIFIICCNSKSNNLKKDYKPIFDFILENNLFEIIPENKEIIIKNPSTRLCFVEGMPAVKYFNKFI